ncbi:hypothetical protein EON67_06735, partial [archaeon]
MEPAVSAPHPTPHHSPPHAETKTVIAAYERCLASGDAEGLAALRAAIDVRAARACGVARSTARNLHARRTLAHLPTCAVQQRIDDLESFYIAHVDDERSILFEKQRLKLRKLVHEYDTMSYAPSGAAAPGTRGSALLETRTSSYGDAPEAAVRSARGADMEGMVTREIRDDTRLQLHELMAWFLQAGVAEMPEVTPEVVERVFVSVTRTNTDGCMSVRDLRQWYITFGRRALREGLPMDSIVSADFVRVATAAAVSARRPDFDPSATSSGLPFAATSSSYTPRKPLYAWEGGASVSGPGTLQLPNGILEFQVRLTPEEYSQLMLRRRML